MKHTISSIKITVLSLSVSLLIGLIVQTFNFNKANPVSIAENIQKTANQEMLQADLFAAAALQTHPDQLEKLFINNDYHFEYYWYENETLLYWSSNEYAFQFSSIKYPERWSYSRASNVHALFKWYSINDSIGLLLLIPVKYSFPYENQFLKNRGIPPFDNLDIELISDSSGNKPAILDADGNYLFSISGDQNHIEYSITEWIGLIAFSFTFIFLLILFFQLTNSDRTHKTRIFFVVSFLYILLFTVLCIIDYPSIFFNNPLFSVHHFTINPLIASFTHLTVYVFLLYTIVRSFSVIFRTSVPKFVAIVLILGVGWLLIEFLRSIVLHSGININFYLLNEISFINSWVHLLLFIMLMSGFEILKTAFPKLFSYQLTAGLYFVVATVLSLGFTHHLQQHKKFTKYQVLTENIRMNGATLQDPITELLLEELSYNLLNDNNLRSILVNNDSMSQIQRYLTENHLQHFSSKYDTEISLVSENNQEVKNYIQMLQYTGIKVGSTNFFNLPESLYEKSYAGIVNLSNDTSTIKSILIEFKNKRNFRSYSLPDLLISETSNALQQRDISTARYENNKLMFSDDRFDWPESGTLFNTINNGFDKLKHNRISYFINQYGNTRIVVTEINNPGRIDKIFYYVLIVIVFLLAARFFYIINRLIHYKTPVSLGLTGKFQIVFTSLLLISFISTLIFSLNYFRKNYENEQLQLSENKRHYIQASLQETLFWVNDITVLSEQRINNILQELAYRYQTDIHIYNQHGELAGSSQNLLFSKQLVSKFIAPTVVFGENIPVHLNEKIGQLHYLTTYAELVNGDYVPLGYIAIPQYFSQTEINKKINLFLIALIQIYTLIILLSIILVIVAGNRLASPIKLMEEKLKTMKLNGRNARIEYRGKDEIGQLVEQYNRTVDELEKSTYLLLKSERESAWRTMARQVAHEINNPLTPMKLTIQQLQRLKIQNKEGFDEYFSTASTTLIEQIDNLSRIAGTFSQFARLPETQLQEIDIAARLYSTVELFKTNSDGILVNYTGPISGIMIKGDPEQLIRVFTNLLKNALQSIPSGRNGHVEIILKVESNEVIISFVDNGIGITPEAQINIFKPNFTTKSSGMGLGLSISKAIVENIGGSISFSSQENKGTVFTIHLPKLV
jgi:signal transduction histidine kinase